MIAIVGGTHIPQRTLVGDCVGSGAGSEIRLQIHTALAVEAVVVGDALIRSAASRRAGAVEGPDGRNHACLILTDIILARVRSYVTTPIVIR